MITLQFSCRFAYLNVVGMMTNLPFGSVVFRKMCFVLM